MLLEFSTTNYKSFKNKMVFSMIPVPKQKGLDYSILKERVGSKQYKGLCSAVIYGPNAAGKTNIIGAMDTFKSIVMRGHIRNDRNNSTPNIASNALELIPNNLSDTAEPVSFAVKFIDHGMLVEYSFSAVLGRFLQADYPRRIQTEALSVNGEKIFVREQGIEFGSLQVIRPFLTSAYLENEESAKSLAEGNLNDEELFLMNGFKTIFGAKLVSFISDWIENKFVVIYRADTMQTTHKFNDSKIPTLYIEKTLNEAAKCFGINSNALGFIVDGNSNEAKLCSIFKGNTSSDAIPAAIFESYGTIRFVNLFPLVADVLLHGGTLVVDEFDASIHPMALMNIVNIFHNDEINMHHAQLIFNTHNPVFLNANLYRRDEIKFVERDEETHISTQYSLADFGTAGQNGVRKNEDYMKYYFVDRYGAIQDIDFSSIFEEMISQEGGDKT